jgi:hypothetical protein
MFFSNCGSELPETGNCPSCGKPRPSLDVQSPPGITRGCLGAAVGWMVAAPLGAFIGYGIGYVPNNDFGGLFGLFWGLVFGVIGSFVGPIVGSVVAIHLAARKAAESKDTEPKQVAASVEQKERP